MFALIRKAVLVGLGTITLAKKTIGTTIEKLSEEGKVSQERGKKFAKVFVKGLSKRAGGLKLKKRVDATIDRVLISAHIPTKDDFKKLNKKLENLTGKIEKK